MSPDLKAIALAGIAVAMLGACGQEPAPQVPAPTPVEVVTVKAQAVPNVIELTGRIASVRMAEVRARTDGIVQRRLYEEGTDVSAGAPLFQIDPRDYQAQVQSAEATLQRAQAARANAASIVSRYKPLIDERAVSAQEYDAARSELHQADAQVSEARAALSRARLLLSYTIVRAPIAGRAGRAEITEGALVTGTEGTLLTQIDQATPVYAVFSAANASILDTAQQVRAGEIHLPSLGRVEVRLVLENGDTYGPVGHLDFASPVVDPETGTQTVRAVFDNPSRTLVPGQFVRGRITAGTRDNGITIPTRAVQMQSGEATVSLVGRDGTVVSKKITLGAMLDNKWIVQSGLRSGDRVITDGWQKVRPGQKAAVRPAKTPPAANAPAKPR